MTATPADKPQRTERPRMTDEQVARVARLLKPHLPLLAKRSAPDRPA